MTSKSFFMSIFANVEYINSNYMTNLYWPIYKKIEKEIVELSNHIHFDDNQLSVYSVKIVELLIRCVVEIEAISKDLYLESHPIRFLFFRYYPRYFPFQETVCFFLFYEFCSHFRAVHIFPEWFPPICSYLH